MSATAVALPTSTNTLVDADLATLFIPIMATQPDGSPCPGTKLPTYTKGDLEKVFFADKNRGGWTLESVFRTASFNKTWISSSTSLVSEFARIGCRGAK